MLARRLTIAGAAVAMLLTLVGAPAGASVAEGRTLRVDDDGHASAGDCGGSAAAPRRIQPAVDAARPGDTIVVCPGTYRGWVDIRTSGITIIGARPWTSTLVPGAPRATDSGGRLPSMITIRGADDVRIQWLRFAVATSLGSGTAGIPQPTCGVEAAIRVTGGAKSAVIRGDRMRASGPGTLGQCGLLSAVRVDLGSSGYAGFNAVRDFRGEAFVASDPGSRLTAVRNSIRFWHRQATGGTPAGSPPDCYYGAGIVFTFGASGSALRNRIVGLPSAATGRTPLLCPGIYLPAAGAGVVLRGNRIQWAFDGINTAEALGVTVEDNVILDSPNDGLLGAAASDGRFVANLVRRSGQFGIIIGPGPAPVTAAATYGVRVAGNVGAGDGTGNRFIDNRSFSNGEQDCYDGTTGARTAGTGNTWRGNRSDGDDVPDGICPAS